ncbi:MAG: hypothetical protein KF712_03265 [Akkermansiaceae bacterium]|nr:hypothetical protein [Akkermansiaceae bacterium]
MNPDEEFEKWKATALRREIQAAEEHNAHRNMTEQRLAIPVDLVVANEQYVRALEKGQGDPKKLFKRFFGVDQDKFESALAAEEAAENKDSAASDGMPLLQRTNSYMLKLAALGKFDSPPPGHPAGKMMSAKFVENRKKLQERYRDDLLETRWEQLSSNLRRIRLFLGGLADDLQSTDPRKSSDTENRLLDPFKNIVFVLATMPRSLRPQAFCELLQGRSEFARIPVINGKELQVRIPLHVPLFEPSGLRWKPVVYDRSLSTWVPASVDLLELSRLKLEDLAQANRPLATRLIHIVTHSDEESVLDDWVAASLTPFKSIENPKNRMTWQGVVTESMRIFGSRIESSNELAEVLGLMRIDNERFSKFLESETDRISIWDSVPSEDISIEKLQRLYSAFNRRTGKFKETVEPWIADPKDLGLLLKFIRGDSCFRKVSSHHLVHRLAFQAAVAERVERTKKREDNFLNYLK